MNLHASIRGLALAVGGLLVLAGVALATGGNGADDASASSASISPSPSAFETAGGALNSPEPTASPEDADDDASPAESPAASPDDDASPAASPDDDASPAASPDDDDDGASPSASPDDDEVDAHDNSGPGAGTTTIPAPVATTPMTIPGPEAETTTPVPAATTEGIARVWAGTWHDEGVDDRALVEATLAGDRQAFGAFVERETRTVYRACLRILGRPHDAEDVTQESFVAAYRAIGSYRGDGPLRGWLLRIATRQAFRRLASRRPTADVDTLPEPFLADSRTDPTRMAVASEVRSELRDAVGALSEPYREVVALRFFAELSLAEVAEATGRPINTVKTHLRRGLERLRPLIDAEGGQR